VVLSLTDLHFDPFGDPALFPALARAAPDGWKAIFEASRVPGDGEYGKDTTFRLLESALDRAARVAPAPEFVVVAGDWLAHRFSETYARYAGAGDPDGLREFIARTIAFVTLRVRARYPRTPIYPALGNNDADCGNYQLQPRGPFLRRTAGLWRPLLRDDGNARAFMQTFPAGGYYAVSVPGSPGHRLLVLNTVFFSSNYQNRCGDPREDPAGEQLRWLTARLEEAAAGPHRVWMLLHIPPGIDAFSTVQAGGSPVSFWRAPHTEAFLALLDRHRDTVVLMLAGHTHRDDFRLMPEGRSGHPPGFLLVTPAVSPIYGNNPGLHVLFHDRATAVLLDYAAHRLDLGAGPAAAWSEEYRFSRAYGLAPVTGATLATLYRSLRDRTGEAGTRYIRFYDVDSAAEPPIADRTWPIYRCAIAHVTPGPFDTCVRD
jgi:hypothetical protein